MKARCLRTGSAAVFQAIPFLVVRVWSVGLILAAGSSLGATYRSPNFVVHADAPTAAKLVSEAAEHYRSHLATEWLGVPLAPWTGACAIDVAVGEMAPGGLTTFVFQEGEIYNLRIVLRGPLQEILDCVLPHEVNHAVFATYFRQPLPRWADEGAATLTEDIAQRCRQRTQVDQLVRRQRQFSLRELLTMREYPPGLESCSTLYAQGFSLCEFLVQNGGKAHYIRFLRDSFSVGWDVALRRAYGYRDIETLEQSWHAWVRSGYQPLVQVPEPPQFLIAGRPGWW